MVDNQGSLGTGYFNVDVYTSRVVGACNEEVFLGESYPDRAVSLVADGQFTFGVTVQDGSCRNFSVIITDIRTNEVVSQGYVLVSNI